MSFPPGNDSASNPSDKIAATWPLLGGLITGLTASACCAGPLILLVLGVSGSWISNLALLEPLRPLLMALAVGFLALAYRRVFRAPPVCAIDQPCAKPAGRKRRKVQFWVVCVLVLAAMAFPWYGPLILDY